VVQLVVGVGRGDERGAVAHADGDPRELPRGIDISAYRIVQEGLTNALKHAHATQAEVALRYAADQLRIEVSDNGHGAGDALLSPAITKRVIKQFTRIPRPAPPKELDELTAREHDILRLISEGLSNAEIGQKLNISETTVKTHVTHILQKLGLRDRVQAVVLAYQAGLPRR
jgi:DNA-binding NarL/FixJ family response regulator